MPRDRVSAGSDPSTRRARGMFDTPATNTASILTAAASARAAATANGPTLAASVPLSSFVGRERELQELKHVLSGTRLLTLTGPGGVGKTRLALEVSRELNSA